jgi:hypothetical protein
VGREAVRVEQDVRDAAVVVDRQDLPGLAGVCPFAENSSASDWTRLKS